MLKGARIVVIVSTVAAALFESYLATQYHPAIFWLSLIGFAALAAAGERLRPFALPILMSAAYLTPAILIATDPAKQADFGLDIVWVLPLLGLSLSARTLDWAVPRRWQWPLVTWSLVVAVAWPLVFLREVDFAPWILQLQRVSNTSGGFSPAFIAQNITYFVLLHNAGILFIDALCRWFSRDAVAFKKQILVPMAATALVAAATAFYQGFVDLGFLQQKFWTYMIRAAGTLGDPNKFGAVAGFWTIGGILLARRIETRWSSIISAASVAIGVGGVWLSGSRTGLAAVIVSLSWSACTALHYMWSNRRGAAVNIKQAGTIAAIVVILAALMIGILQRSSTHTIVARGTLGYLPFIGDRGIVASANELLWERFGYGLAAIEMVKEHPIDGIGIGMFHALVIDYGKIHGKFLPTDNAQSWFRHVIAESGLVGSIPILWWSAVFLLTMFARSEGDRLTIGMLRAVLLGFATASVFGMPAQSIAIVMTFWVFAFWLLLESIPTAEAPKPWRTLAIAATIAIVVLNAGATTVDAFGSLRPLERAKRWDWYYRYGWVQPDDVEKDPGGNPVGRRWTMKKSLALIPVKGRALKLTAWVDHPDSSIRPVHTRVWADGVLVFEGDLRRGTPLMMDLPAKTGEKYLVLETEIDRVFRPSDFNPTSRDRRELGLSVRDWIWE